MASKRLDSARKQKEDEFYTRLSDIENELKHYKKYFEGKTVLCNCDDPRVSNFFYFFYSRFHGLGLKRLIATCYKNLSPDLFSQNLDEQAVYCIYDGTDRSGDVITNYDTFIKQNEWGILKGDGDFRSPECIELLKQADIICTNPPFSLFREYVTQLIEYKKKFIILGNKNAIAYKDIFKFIKDGQLKIGYLNINSDIWFMLPDTAEKWEREENGKKLKHIMACWYTNFDIEKHHEHLVLYKHYNPKEYPKYDYYDAIEVGKVAEIPQDYDGVMGVPITFLDKYNPEQFEIIDEIKRYAVLDVAGINQWAIKNHLQLTTVNGKAMYARILIKRKQNEN
jgi:hypothetical protein